MSKGGKSIIVLPSRTDDGKESRIVPYLQRGGGVVLTRGDIHYVITEYGVAYLHGKSIRDRALILINIAHPDFREELLEAAKEQGYVYKDQILPVVLYPEKYETYFRDKKDREIFFALSSQQTKEASRIYFILSLNKMCIPDFLPASRPCHIR